MSSPTFLPRTARSRMLASSTSERSATAPLFLPQPVELLDERIFARAVLTHPGLQRLVRIPIRGQVLRLWPAPHGDVKADRAAVLGDSHGLLGFGVFPEAVAELAHSDFRGVHGMVSYV